MDLDERDEVHDSGHVKHEEDVKTVCREAVLKIFPDICPNYVETLAIQNAYDHEALITAILDQFERGKAVPKRQRLSLKRKRGPEDDGDRSCDHQKKYDNAEWRQKIKHPSYINIATQLLRDAFPSIMVKHVTQVFAENNYTLFSCYLKLVRKEASETWTPKKRPAKSNPAWEDDRIDDTIKATLNPEERVALEELKIARQAGEALKLEMLSDKQQEQGEIDNFNKAKMEGTTSECECCCDEFALNRMVHCDGENLHWFCRNCARLNAETQIGLSKFELNCMSMDGCTAGFSRQQRDIFLDEKTSVALDRIEQEAALRLAGIENLETCPFCPYAAEYPPVEFDKEFRCERPDCEVVSCRLCRKETHIPKTCEEAALEAGHSSRRAIEEAMSAAMIRKCNKCGTPFIKENGCNKMTCTQAGCRNVQCYVCHKSCDYAHFNDPHRGGKVGNCPLFDSVEDRHLDEVRRAEEAARKKAQEEHPDVNAELFEIKVSDKVKEDEEKRRKRDEAARGLANGRARVNPPPGLAVPIPG
ncbi:hypothetical protein BR93DRAFT_871254 [Coniochaeta sp. PMI_546]|nr:hypothetical protein BR93DRAFT_871254 [Coniochaeta sp. PMI_546]